MPISLLPTTRREFLGRMALAAGGVLLSRPWFAGATAGNESSTWALLADTHIAGDRKAVMRGVTMSEHLAQVAREVLELPSKPAGLLVNGDCAYGTGQTEDYAGLAELVEPLRKAAIPLHFALGNHDHRERFAAGLSWTMRNPPLVVDKHVSLVRSELADWYVLDSLEITNSTPGLLGKEQLQWLEKSLDETPDKPALIVVHHNPGLEGNFGLKDTVALLDLLRSRRRVKAYFFGHTHEWKVDRDTGGLHLVNLPPVAYVFKEGLPSGWVRADLRSDGMRLQLQCVKKDHPAHLQTHDLAWR